MEKLIKKLEDVIDYITKSTSWEVTIEIDGEFKKFKHLELIEALREAEEYYDANI